MSKAAKSMANFTILFVAFCHSVIFNQAFTRDESAQNAIFKIKNKLPACFFYAI